MGRFKHAEHHKRKLQEQGITKNPSLSRSPPPKKPKNIPISKSPNPKTKEYNEEQMEEDKETESDKDKKKIVELESIITDLRKQLGLEIPPTEETVHHEVVIPTEQEVPFKVVERKKKLPKKSKNFVDKKDEKINFSQMFSCDLCE